MNSLEKEKNIIPIEKSVLLYNAVIFILAAILIFSGKYYYDKLTTQTVLQENRYITTEWHLMQILKEQTDKQLLVLNREIDLLKSQYDALRRRDRTDSALKDLQGRLQSAEKERKDILNMRSLATPETLSQLQEIDLSKEQINQTVQKILDEKRISELNRRISADQESITMLTEKLLETQLENKELQQTLLNKDAELEAGKSAYRSLISSGISDMQALISRIEQNSELPPPADMDDLLNYELSKAILSLPQIRNDHPGILDGLDNYISGFGETERVNGRNEAYSEIMPEVQDFIRYLEEKQLESSN